MRKWSLIIFCLVALAGLIVIAGCEGDAGPVGGKGPVGPIGPGGTDTELMPPAGRTIAFGITNDSLRKVDGSTRVYLTFDSTATGTGDTLVANRVSIPPLIDGVDGEETEWGAQKSRIRPTYLTLPDTLPGPGTKVVTARAAYDDQNVYFLFQWQEQPIKTKVDNKDLYYFTTSETYEMNVLGFSARAFHGLDTNQYQYNCATKTKIDSLFTYMRIKYDSLCALGDPCMCWNTRAIADTTFVWKPGTDGEDRLVLFLPKENPPQGWQNVAFNNYFNFTGTPDPIPSNMFVDVWAWGSATTKPVAIADDWSITSAGLRPDAGQAPYINNYLLPDSTPRYMNRLDPGMRTDSTGGTMQNQIYPLWYFDAVGFVQKGWTRRNMNYVPGIVTTIPSGSRADVYAVASFDNSLGTWTVELKRARKTNSGDDVQF